MLLQRAVRLVCNVERVEREVGNSLQRKSHLCVHRKGIARPESQFPHSCVYIPTIGLPILLQENMWTDRVNI